MQCERLVKLIKSWYLKVEDETMAPARMVSFIKQHAAECDVCRADPDIQEEIEKNTKATVLIWAGSCFGACDLPNIKNLGIDLLIQWGHSEFK